MVFAADGSFFCGASRKLVVTRFHLAAGRAEQIAVVDPKEVPVRSDVIRPISTVALSPNRMAWGNGDYRIGLADLTQLGTATRPAPTIKLLRGHKAAVVALAFSPDGNTLASSDMAGGVIRWTLPSPGVPFSMLQSQASFRTVVLAFSPDGKRLYGGGEHGEVWCRNPVTFETIGPLPSENTSEVLR